MKFKSYAMFAVMAGAMSLTAPVMAASQTAQSAMVEITPAEDIFKIEGTITWTYHRDSAETYYTNAWNGVAPTVSPNKTTTETAPTAPDAPAPDGNKLRQHAQAQRTVFFCGGDLESGDTYTQTDTKDNGKTGKDKIIWTYTYTYTITPNPEHESVEPHTFWTSVETGGTVDITFSGFISSESYMKNGTKTKYSFTLTEPDPLGGSPLSRVHDVSAQLQKSDGLGGWTDVGDPIDLTNGVGTLPVVSTAADYSYFGNAGFFGNSAVYGALHVDGYRPATMVLDILLSDNFANNDNDLTSGSVHQADYNGIFEGITDEGDYRIQVSGTIKGNSANATGQDFTVDSNIIINGGFECN